jgi:hypothetical protein
MNESTIAAFLAGDIDADRLALEVRNSEREVDPITTAVTVSEMKSEFAITRTMALQLCDAVSNGTLRGEVLRTVAFVIISSDHLTWGEDEVLGEIIWDWSCPEVNYPLTPENMARCRKWLTGTESYPSKTASIETEGGTLVSRLVLKRE